jgi:integrase
MAKLTYQGLAALIEKPGRHSDGDGLYFRTLGLGRAYWVYRYRVNGREREMSLGPYPELSLKQAREKHASIRNKVLVDKSDPLALKRAAKAAATISGVPTFGQCADEYLQAHETEWGNLKHRAQWRTTIGQHCSSIKDVPVDQVDAKAVQRVLLPIWSRIPQTANRLRGRIEKVLDYARALGYIDEDKANPAQWQGRMEHLLSKLKKADERPHHASMPYADLPKFMRDLAKTEGSSAKALRFTILTCARSNEALGAVWGEIDWDNAVWNVSAERMKKRNAHSVPLSDAALAILRTQFEASGESPYVFPGALRGRPLSVMAMKETMRRHHAGEWTPHGMRSAARSWMADQGVAFELAEACLAHKVGDATVAAYQRSEMLERRRPIMSAWANFVSGHDTSNVVPLRKAGA